MSTDFKGKDIISIRDFSKDDLLYILSIAAKIEKKNDPSLLAGKIASILFYEPSTRTRLSFAAAIKRMGGNTIGFDQGEV